MAIKQDDVTYSKETFAAIEVKGVIYLVNAQLAKGVREALSKQMIFTSAENPIRTALEEVSEFVIDAANGVVIKPKA